MCGSRDPHHFINTPLNPKPNLYVPGIESGVKLTLTSSILLDRSSAADAGMWGWFRDRAASWSCEALLFLLFGSDWSTQLTLGLYIVRSRHYNNPACVSHRRLQQHLGVDWSTVQDHTWVWGTLRGRQVNIRTSQQAVRGSNLFLLSSSLSCTSITSITNTYYVTMATAVTMTFFKNNLMWHHQPFLSNCNLVLFSVHGHKLVRLSRVQTHEDSGQVWRLWDPHPLDCGKKLAQAWGQRAAPAQQEGRSFLRWGHGRGHYPLGGRGGLRVWLRFNYSIKCTLICHQHSGGATVTHSAFPRW